MNTEHTKKKIQMIKEKLELVPDITRDQRKALENLIEKVDILADIDNPEHNNTITRIILLPIIMAMVDKYFDCVERCEFKMADEILIEIEKLFVNVVEGTIDGKIDLP